MPNTSLRASGRVTLEPGAREARLDLQFGDVGNALRLLADRVPTEWGLGFAGVLAAPVQVTVESADLIVESGDPMFGAVRLRIGAEAAETLAARLRAQAG